MCRVTTDHFENGSIIIKKHMAIDVFVIIRLQSVYGVKNTGNGGQGMMIEEKVSITESYKKTSAG